MRWPCAGSSVRCCSRPSGISIGFLRRRSPKPPVFRVSNNVARLGSPKEGPRPGQLLSLPNFSAHHMLTGKKSSGCPERLPQDAARVTAISWLKHYSADVPRPIIQTHFNKGQVCCNEAMLDEME